MFWHYSFGFATGFRIRELFQKLHLLILRIPTHLSIIRRVPYIPHTALREF